MCVFKPTLSTSLLVETLERKAIIGGLRKTWQNIMSANMRPLKVGPQDGHDRKKWRARRPQCVWNSFKTNKLILAECVRQLAVHPC